MSKESDIYDYIKAHQEKGGSSLNLKYAAEEIGIPHRSILYMVKKMMRKGYMEGIEGRRGYILKQRPPQKVNQRKPWSKEVINEALEIYREGKSGAYVADYISKKYNRKCTNNTVFNWHHKYSKEKRSLPIKMRSNPWLNARRIIQSHATYSIIDAGLYLEKCGEPQWMIDSAIMTYWVTGEFFKPKQTKTKRKAA